MSRVIMNLDEWWPNGQGVYPRPPGDRGFEHHTGHDNDSSYDTSTGLQEADSRVINNKLLQLDAQSS